MLSSFPCMFLSSTAIFFNYLALHVFYSNDSPISSYQVDNFIHADMHPGNILVRVPHGKSRRKRLFNSKPHVVFLDVGMTAELSGNDRVNLLEFFKAVARRDGRSVAECTLRLSKQQNCPDPEAFIEVIPVHLYCFLVSGVITIRSWNLKFNFLV